MPNVSGRGHGDLHVIAGVAVPTEAQRRSRSTSSKSYRKTLPSQEDDLDRQDAGEKPFFERVKDIFG